MSAVDAKHTFGKIKRDGQIETVTMFIELFKGLESQEITHMVQAEGDEMLRHQGAVRFIRSMSESLTRKQLTSNRDGGYS